MDLRGAMSMAPSFDAGGWFAASPGLFGLAGPVFLKDWQRDAGSPEAIGVLTDAFANADGPIAELSRNFLQLVSAELPATKEIQIAGEKIDHWREAMRLVQAHEVWQSFGHFISQGDLNLGPGIAERMKIASSVSASQVRNSKVVLDEVVSRLEQATAGRTVLVLPTCPSIAPSLQSTAEELERFRVNTMRLVCMASISGLPQITIPIGTVANAPVGLSFLGWRHGEEALFRLASRLAPYIGGCA
jgi:amidase